MRKKITFLIILGICGLLYSEVGLAQGDSSSINRAKYWAKQGFHFDPKYMTAYSMDRKVQDIKRARYWAKQGFHFDPSYMTAYSMDRKVQDIKRARYWAKQGFHFDPSYMTAYSMDQEAKTLIQQTSEKKIIKAIQLSLELLSYDPGPIDGIAGPKTIAALQSFNTDNAQEPDQFISQQTRKLIAKRLLEHVDRSLPQTLKRTELANYILDYKGRIVPRVTENNSYYGEISTNTGRPKTVYVRGYYRKDGTYVRSHYRSRPRR